MKLLVDCHCFDYPTPQGINTYIQGLYTALIPKAQDIQFYLAANNIDNLRNIFGEHSNIEYVKIPKAGSFSRLASVFPKIISKYSIDYAHFQYVAPFIKNCKTIITLHDILFKDFPQYFPLSYRVTKGLMFKYSAKHADVLLTVSEYSKERIVHHFKIESNKIYVTPNAVEDRFSVISREEGIKFASKNYNIDRYIIYVSRQEPRKNQYGLVKAYIASNLWKSGIDLVILGEKTLEDRNLLRLLEGTSDDIKSCIHFLSGIDNDSLTYLLKGASLFVYPSMAEGFGIPPLEAGIAKIPTLCNNSTAMGDFKFFGPNLIDTSNTENLASEMQRILANPPSEQELHDVYNSIMNQYNWKAIAQNFYEVLISRS